DRKVSIRDEYGEENLAAWGKEARICFSKIAKRDGIPEAVLKEYFKKDFAFDLPEHYRGLLSELEKRFHEFRRNKPSGPRNDQLGDLSGVEFETYVASLLDRLGYGVKGTPGSGDQGADLIATKSGKRIVIQAKRYSAPVGNGAVQEVISAKSFYEAD